VLRNLLLALQSCSYLGIFILVICCTVCILREVDVEVLGLLSVVVVSCAKESYQQLIVLKTMELWQVELLSNTEVNKDLFVIIKAAKRLFKSLKGAHCMRGKLGQEQEIKQCTHGTKYM
jgi:hypothetical protein